MEDEKFLKEYQGNYTVRCSVHSKDGQRCPSEGTLEIDDIILCSQCFKNYQLFVNPYLSKYEVGEIKQDENDPNVINITLYEYPKIEHITIDFTITNDL